MSPTIIDGKGTAQTIREEIAREVELITGQGHRPPGLAVVLVGEDPASQVYTRNKEKMSREAGFKSVKIDLPADTAQEKLLATVEDLNNDESIDGILVQLPLPAQCDAQAVINAIDPDKDVDGFHPINAGRLATGAAGVRAVHAVGVS